MTNILAYAKKREHWNSDLKCLVITIKSVARKEFIENGIPTGELLVPVEDIYMSCPLDEPKEV